MKTLYISIIVIVLLITSSMTQIQVYAQTNQDPTNRMPRLNCSKQITEKMNNMTLNTNFQKASNLALNSTEFKSRFSGYEFNFEKLFNEYSWNPVTCDVTVKTVNVYYGLINKTWVKDILIVEDPSMTTIVKIMEKPRNSFTMILPATRQFNSGVPIQNIECTQDSQLVFRISDGSPACIKSENVQKMVDRGWGSNKVLIITDFCKNAMLNAKGTNVLVTCMHQDSDKNIYNLPPPVYRRELNNSTHGGGGKWYWGPQIPQDLLKPDQKQQVIDKLATLPQVNQFYPDWKLGTFNIQPESDKWFAYVEIILPVVRLDSKCGWYYGGQVDLQTLELLRHDDRDVTSKERCVLQ